MLIESKSLVVYGIFQELRDTFLEFCNCNLYRSRSLDVCVTFSSMTYVLHFIHLDVIHSVLLLLRLYSHRIFRTLIIYKIGTVMIYV